MISLLRNPKELVNDIFDKVLEAKKEYLVTAKKKSKVVKQSELDRDTVLNMIVKIYRDLGNRDENGASIMALNDLISIDKGKPKAYENTKNGITLVFQKQGKKEAKSAGKNGIDIGDGIAVKKIGNDANGNWSYWILRPGKKSAAKIQTTNLDGGSGKVTDINQFKDGGKDSDGTKAIKLIKDYAKDFLK